MTEQETRDFWREVSVYVYDQLEAERFQLVRETTADTVILGRKGSATGRNER
jgi:hypothetical protein